MAHVIWFNAVHKCSLRSLPQDASCCCVICSNIKKCTIQFTAEYYRRSHEVKINVFLFYSSKQPTTHLFEAIFSFFFWQFCLFSENIYFFVFFFYMHSADPGQLKRAKIFMFFLDLIKLLFIWDVHLVPNLEITLWNASRRYW